MWSTAVIANSNTKTLCHIKGDLLTDSSSEIKTYSILVIVQGSVRPYNVLINCVIFYNIVVANW